MSAGDIDAIVTLPSGVSELCDVSDLSAGDVCIEFRATETGGHSVEVLRGSQPLTGSPFMITVGCLSPPQATPLHSSVSAAPNLPRNISFPYVRIPWE